MAEGAISSAVEKLGNLLLQEVIFLSGVRGDVEWLQNQLRWMQSFMKDADIKSRKGDERIKTWINLVREVAFEAEDVLDTFMLKIEKRRGAITEFFRKYACTPLDLIDLHDIGKKILHIKSKVHDINESRQAYGIVDLGENRAESGSGSVTESCFPGRQFSPHLDDDTVVVGIDASKNFILRRLLDYNVNQRRQVVSIVGMGGLGKTTLAAKVYNSDEVKSHFITRVWITVSQTYNVRVLLKQLVKKVVVDMPELEGMEENELKTKLYDALRNIRYLIVLDDIWDELVWGGIKDAFPNATNGSRVLITTRLMEVARSTDPSSPPYELPFLNPEESWELFLNKVFPSHREGGAVGSCPEDLEEFGKEKLVKRCGGLPLAVVVLGALLSRTEKTIMAWRDVAEGLDWRSTYEADSSLKILALSYHKLPHHHLKSCFLYLGCFPEDFEIRASDVIRLWIAEGFVDSYHDNHILEETAADYLEDLARRCMVQVVKRSKTWKRVKIFRIHDLFREFCLLEAKEVRFFRICSSNNSCSENAAKSEITSSRRLVLNTNSLSSEFFSDILHNSACKARTILSMSFTLEYKIAFWYMGVGFKLLRVIYMDSRPKGAIISRLPKEIWSLIRLRSLTLRGYDIYEIPSSIWKLQNLQTLDLGCSHIYNIPETLHKVETLRHLVVRWGYMHLSDSTGSLRNLQTLRTVSAESLLERGRLSMLTSLRELHIFDVGEEHMTELSDSLPKLKNLTSLKLSSESLQAGSLFSAVPSHYNHLYKLRLAGRWVGVSRCLPQNLINVRLQGMTLDRDMIAALERLPNLKFLTCSDCKIDGDVIVCSAGGFSQLRFFTIDAREGTGTGDGDGGIYHWKIEKGALPNLQYLHIKDCPNLAMVPEGLEHVTSLQKLVITGPNDEILRRLEVEEEDGHKIQHIPSVQVFNRWGKPIAMKRPGSNKLVFIK